MIALVCHILAKNRKVAIEALMPFLFNPSLGTFGHIWARLWSNTTKIHVNPYLVSAVFDATKNLIWVSDQLSVKTAIEPWLYVIFRCENWLRATFETQTAYLLYIANVPSIRHFWLALSHMTPRRLRHLSVDQLGAIRRQFLSIIELIMVLSEEHAKDCHKALEEYLHKSIDDDVLEWWKKACNLFPLDVQEQVEFWMGFLSDPYSLPIRLKCLDILTICCTKDKNFKLSKIIAHGIVDLLISMPNEYHETIALSLIQLQDLVVVLEFTVQTPLLAAKRLGIGALVANQELFLERINECNNYTPEQTLVSVARLGLSLSTKDAEFLAIANGIAQLLGKAIVSIAVDKSVYSQAFMDLAVALTKQLDIMDAVLTQVLSQYHDDEFDPRYVWTLLTALAPIAPQSLWCPLWQLWRKLMQPENFAHVTRLAACMGWMISLESLCIDDRFVYCGACEYVGLDSVCPACCIPGGDPFKRDLLLVQGPWLEQSNPEALAMRCTLLSALTQTYSSLNCQEKQTMMLDKVKYLVYTLPVQMPHLCAILEQPLFQRTMRPLAGLIAKYQIPCVVPRLPPVRPWEPLPFSPSPSKVEATENVYGTLNSAHRGIKRLMLSHPIWLNTQEFVYRVDTAEFGAKRLRPRLTPALKSNVQSQPRHSRLFESLSDPLGSSIDLWRHSSLVQIYFEFGSNHVDDVMKSSSVFQAYILLLRPQRNLPGELTITNSTMEIAFHDSKVESKSKETSQIKFLLGRRYLLQSHIALEIFWYGTAAPWLVVFDSSIACKRCYTACQTFALENLVFNTPRLTQAEAYQKYRLITSVNVPTGMEYLCIMNATARWLSRSMSTFEYLIHVNTAAGRTYNDLNQYFVFPWVEDPIEHQPRDFKLPMGAINPKRLQQCQARAATMTTELIGHEGTPPPFLYGSHYSTTGSVLYFLLRLAPFTQCAKDLQGGKLDHPDRLFHSWNETWTNCLTSSDVKELIPELFYHIDIFYASEDFGMRQNGEKVGDVVLPTADMVAFIARQQRNLESNEDIPYWINLIFGVLNSGDAAWTAKNMFFHLTYAEHAPAISLNFKPNAPPESDPSVEAATTQLLYFGQTPPQVFTASHPLRQAQEIKSFDVQLYTRVPSPSPITWIIQNYKSLQVLSLDGVVCTLLEDANVLVHDRTIEMAFPVSEPGAYYLFTSVFPEFKLYGWFNGSMTEAQSVFLPDKVSVVEIATSPSNDALVIITMDGLMQVWDSLTLMELLFPEVLLSVQLPETSKWSQVTSIWTSMWKEEVVLPSRRRPQLVPYRTFGLGDVSIVCASVNLAVDLACTCTSSTITTWALRSSKCLRAIELDKVIGRAVNIQRISIHAPESYMIAISTPNDEHNQATMDVIALDVNGRLLSISSWPASCEFYFAWMVSIPNAPECPPLVLVVIMNDLVLYSVWDCQWIVYSKHYHVQVSYAAVENDHILLGFYSGDVEIVPLDGIYTNINNA
ncbi:hypothetical protein THRCLA_09558 [Thraustotheca clavata]|uniref:BEACH domain-containing protein n=1 Tax=Thraustotheca clavata TaxID=74557 RepID=A0A1V9YVS2_9STRA|nr:hypothetical protein THRCLA_09558 [Thraustotheca clavata]